MPNRRHRLNPRLCRLQKESCRHAHFVDVSATLIAYSVGCLLALNAGMTLLAHLLNVKSFHYCILNCCNRQLLSIINVHTTIINSITLHIVWLLSLCFVNDCFSHDMYERHFFNLIFATIQVLYSKIHALSILTVYGNNNNFCHNNCFC